LAAARPGAGECLIEYVAPDTIRNEASVMTTAGELTLSGAEMIAAIRALFGNQHTPLSANAKQAYDDTKAAFDATWRPVIDRLK